MNTKSNFQTIFPDRRELIGGVKYAAQNLSEPSRTVTLSYRGGNAFPYLVTQQGSTGREFISFHSALSSFRSIVGKNVVRRCL